MPCLHCVDLCENCLEKVETEEELQKKSPPEKTITRDNKRKKILFDSALLAALGYAAYHNTKLFLGIFDLSVIAVSNLLKTITTRTSEE